MALGLGGLLASGATRLPQRDEYDQTTWAARTWRSFAVQRLSVAVHKAAAMELVRALSLTTAYDSRAAEAAYDVA